MLLPPLAPDRATTIIAAFRTPRIVVLGDVMIDRFLVGSVTRLSPEAPVPIVAFDHETLRLGGAANVAHNVTALGGSATLIGVTGRDEAADALRRECDAADIAVSFVSDSSRSTTTKVRIVTERNQQVARIDYESDHDVSADVERQLIAALQQAVAGAAALIVSDYLKGCVTRAVMQAALESAAARRIPLLVDPKIAHIDYYAGATLVTPNHHEAEAATLLRVRHADDARMAARAFRDRARCASVLMTRGDQGIWLLSDEAEGYLPAAAREVADVTGAGDTVIATLGLSLAAGATMVEASHLANEAAGIAVGKFGPAVVPPEQLTRALELREQARVFDIQILQDQLDAAERDAHSR